MHAPSNRPCGFTIIEIIVTIVVAGFLGLVVVNLMSTQLVKSSAPLLSAQEAANAEAAMENVVAYYASVMNNGTIGTLADVSNHYAGNATVAFSSSTFYGQNALKATVTVGKSTLTTLLFLERTNAADSAVFY